MTARLVIAGTASGVGKTTVVVALAQALRKRGLSVAAFKCGPDYLDPTYHARATGAPCHNLDGWMMGRDAVQATFSRAAVGADVALIEGMMGLYDGASAESDEGSAAQIAKWLSAPVIAVVDASAIARTIAALGLGLRRFDEQVVLAGLFANRIGGQGHLDILRAACAGGDAPPVLGGLPARPALAFPERHLGLRTADRDTVADEQLAAWGSLIEEWVSLDQLLRIARSAPELPVPAAEPVSRPRCRIGLASDGAFHFYYEDNLRRLESLGAELVRFSPVSDRALPPRLDGLYLGGGYPEVYAAELAANGAMREAIVALARAGAPVYAECGGLMYLAQAIRTLDGREHAMCGLLPGVAVMRDRLEAIGYVEVEIARRTVLGDAGLRMRGHQFRYSALEGATSSDRFYGEANVLASYVHAHWASNPRAAEGLVASCAAYASSR